MQPRGEHESTRGDELGDIREGGICSKDGKESGHVHFMWCVGYTGARGDTWSFGPPSRTPLLILAFLSMVVNVPSTVWCRCGPGRLHSGAAASRAMSQCVMEPWDPKWSTDVSGRGEAGCTPHPFLCEGILGHVYICCYVRQASISPSEDAEPSAGDKYSRGRLVLCSSVLSHCHSPPRRLDPTLASFCSLTLGVTP